MAHLLGTGMAGGGNVDLDEDAHRLTGAIHEVFSTMDADGTATVHRDDLEQLMLKSGIQILDGQLETAMAELDHTGSGQVGYKNFAQWMMSGDSLATQLRREWKSSILGGNAFQDLVDEADLARKNRTHNSYVRWIFWSEDEQGQRNVMQSIWIFMEEPETSKGALMLSIFIQILIFISSVIFICDTIRELKQNDTFASFAHTSEFVLVSIFTLEYLIRVGTCTQRPEEDQGLLSYIKQPMNMVDFFAILPTYVEAFLDDGAGGGSMAVLRILRMARIIRVIKVGTFKENLILVAEGLRRSITGLILLVYLVLIFMVVMASVMYMLESDTEPCEVIENRTAEENYRILGRGGCSTFIDIPHTFWFVIVTMTSVGYGDMFPYSDAGRAVGAIIMLSGILTLAVPITLISNKFNHVWLEAKTKKRKEQTIQHLITGSPTGEDDTKIEETADMMNSIDTRTATVKLLLKQSYQVSSDDRFLSAVHLLDTPGLETSLNEDVIIRSRIKMATTFFQQSYKLTNDAKFLEAVEILAQDAK